MKILNGPPSKKKYKKFAKGTYGPFTLMETQTQVITIDNLGFTPTKAFSEIYFGVVGNTSKATKVINDTTDIFLSSGSAAGRYCTTISFSSNQASFTVYNAGGFGYSPTYLYYYISE